MGTVGDNWGDECSVIEDKGEIGFIDYEDDKSVCSYNPVEEGPVVISVPFPFTEGKPQSVFVGDMVTDSITIRNTTADVVDLWTKIYASTPEDSFKLSLMKPPSADSAADSGGRCFVETTKLEDRMVQPGETLTIWLSCKPKDIGLHTTVVHFDVGDDRIERVVFLLVEDKISQSLASKMPYKRGKKVRRFSVESYVVGSHPARLIDWRFKKRLPRYDIPKDIRQQVESKQIPDAIFGGLTRDNYSSYFKTLVILEEIQLEEYMRGYDMENVTMRKNGSFLTLKVPGLAERRPSLVHGDHIFAKLASQDTSEMASPFQGFIHRVESDEVFLKFAPNFHSCHRNDNFYDVRFTYNRINMRRQYQAIDAAENLELELLFLSECPEYRLIDTNPLVPKTCTLNEEQMRAIEMILGCKGGPPYVIYGPPGTGKTMTVVEAVLQLYSNREYARILVCAPSNSAADHILEKLLSENDLELKENEIFRLNAATRPYDDVKPDHIRFCFFNELVFKCPPFSALGRYRIIVSTYMSASLLYAEGVQRGHFSHIFLDEAGQASEPESMIPIANLCLPDTVVVLAGDPMQLGPVVYSREAESYGLGKSYLERLCESGYYSAGDENYVTKLVRNYRCHPEILHLPSMLFYNGDLISCKDDTGSFLNSVKFLPNKDFPVFFFGIQGCDEREGSNPSWFNRFEVSKVAEFIKSLTYCGSLSEEDIGVITPYRQQVLKLKKALENLEMPDIKVGTVEQFQGQERKVIIISTVRSTIKHNDFDRAHCLGFLSNPKRFNVAITRAISLLVIVGNPHILAKDPYWSKLIWRSSDNNCHMGCALPERQEYVEVAMPEDNVCQSTRVEEWVQNCIGTEMPQPLDEAEFSDGWN